MIEMRIINEIKICFCLHNYIQINRVSYNNNKLQILIKYLKNKFVVIKKKINK